MEMPEYLDILFYVTTLIMMDYEVDFTIYVSVSVKSIERNQKLSGKVHL